MLRRSFEVEPGEEGQRLDRLAASRLAVSRNFIKRIIQEKRLLVDGREAEASHRVRSGERIEASIPEETPQPEDISVTVIFEDEDLIVVDKPAGLLVHPGAGNRTGTLVNALIERGIAGGEDPVRPGVVHRLDRDTSGVMVLAKSESAYSRLVKMLSKRHVRRIYRTIVVSGGLPETGTIDSPVGRDPENPTLMAAGVGKPAVTHFEMQEETERHTMLRVRLETGRTHQIRVHLSAIGHPVYADPRYGKAVPDRRLWLHAERLVFEHPLTGQTLEFEAALPEDLRDSAAALGFPVS